MRRALIMSGGGAKGAFTVGALGHLAGRGIRTFDVISGTSTGSLISALACTGAFDILRAVYTTVQDDDILQRQNIVANVMQHKPYIFDTEPLRAMIDQHVTPGMFAAIAAGNTRLCLTAISLQSGRPTVFCSHDIPATGFYDTVRIDSRARLNEALLASSSQAGFLPPVSITVNGVTSQYVDGGNREVLPSRVVTDLMGAAAPGAAPDEIYVLSNNPSAFAASAKQYTDLLPMLMRAISIFIQDVRENDLDVLRAYCARTGTRLILIEPTKDLDVEYPTGLRFDQALMSGWMRQGELRAQLALQAAGVVV